MKKVILLAAALLLSACASSGVKVDPDKLSRFEKGKSTYAEVIASFGKPTTRVVTDYGTTISYTYVGVQARPESFIPIVGAFAGGADSEMTMVSLTFNKAGILTNTTGMSNESGHGHNLEGMSQSRKEVREVE